MVDTLTPADVEHFVSNGFVRVAGAFPTALADAGRALLWTEMGLSPEDPAGWPQAVVRLPGSGATPFRRAANTERLRVAYDQLVGQGRWLERTGLGTFPVRFPGFPEPDDTGWHCDGSFGGWPYRLNLRSHGRALLMLFLFSEVTEADAPTRIRVGSHLDIPALLAPRGDEGMTFVELAEHFGELPERPLAHATGSAGDVYLCHPFLVHAAQQHHGTLPRFIAQPPLEPVGELLLERPDQAYSAVERAIRIGLGLDPHHPVGAPELPSPGVDSATRSSVLPRRREDTAR